MTKLQRRVLTGGVVALALLVAGGALAKETGGTTSAAAKAFAKGSELFKQRDYVGAIDAFEEAYRLRPHFMVQCNIARCYEWSGDFVHAAERYQRCLDEGAKGTAAGKKVEDSLTDVQARITWVAIESPGGGGTVYVDGQAAGAAPGKVPINPGTHVIEVRRANAAPASETIKTRGGELKTLTLAPVDLASKAAPESSPRERARLKPLWFWVAAGATAALGITAIGLGAGTLKARSDFENRPTEDSYQSAVNLRTATNVMWALTAVAAGTGTVLFFYTDFHGPAERGTAVSLGLQGRF